MHGQCTRVGYHVRHGTTIEHIHCDRKIQVHKVEVLEKATVSYSCLIHGNLGLRNNTPRVPCMPGGDVQEHSGVGCMYRVCGGDINGHSGDRGVLSVSYRDELCIIGEQRVD
jgi:hypothetical protein